MIQPSPLRNCGSRSSSFPTPTTVAPSDFPSLRVGMVPLSFFRCSIQPLRLGCPADPSWDPGAQLSPGQSCRVRCLEPFAGFGMEAHRTGWMPWRTEEGAKWMASQGVSLHRNLCIPDHKDINIHIYIYITISIIV